jgi:phosphonate transport system ATP-binding protein
MRLLVELAHENNTPALVNIHDVALAQTFSDRIIGLADGRIVFDGTAEDITSDVLTQIYGEEDWSTTIRKVDEEDENGGEKAKKNDLIRESSAG